MPVVRKIQRVVALLIALLICAGLTAPDVEARWFESDGVKLHYVAAGQGDPVILVHALYANALTDWRLPGTMARLSRHFWVIALDNRGRGQSDKPTEEGQYGVKMVEDLVHLMDEVHIKKAQFVGYSMGGMIVMKLLALHPERVSSVILGGSGWLQAGKPLDLFWERVPDIGKRRPVARACLDGMTELAVTKEDIEKINVPLSIIIGENDPCKKLYVEPLRELRPDFPLVTIPRTGHFNCVFRLAFRAEIAKILWRQHESVSATNKPDSTGNPSNQSP